MAETVLIRVPPGWTASDEGYFLNAAALGGLTAAAKTYRLERDAWERAYCELSERSGIFAVALNEQVADLTRQIEAERSAWSARVKRAKWAKNPGFGVFAGAAYAGSGEVEAVVGVGVVWRIF